MGMTHSQLLLWLQLPLAAPIIMAGIRTAVVMGIAIAAIAAFIGAGGLGLFVAEGLQMATNNAVVTGAISMGLLSIIEIHRSELDYARKNGGTALITLLQRNGHFPYSDLERPPVA